MKRSSPSPTAPGITSKSRSRWRSSRLHIAQILEYRAEKGIKTPAIALERKDIIGSSKRLDDSFELLSQAAQSDVNVLITGESGTGKELFAKAIHSNSKQGHGQFRDRRLHGAAGNPRGKRSFRTCARVVHRGLSSARTGWSSRPTRAPCSSTRSASCRCRSRRPSCGSSRSTVSARWAGARRSAAISGWWGRPTAAWKTWWRRGCFAKTCSSGCARW